MEYADLSAEQQLFCDTALAGHNIRVEACIGSGKTTAIQSLCDLFPPNKLILYLTYNKLLKIDAQQKIKNPNVTVTNYHGFVYPFLQRNHIQCSISDSIRIFTQNRLSIPRYDILIIDEYQDIELDFADMLEYVKSTNPAMQIIMVGDMAQKIYDKTTLDVVAWAPKFLESFVDLEFTQCFRLQAELAKKLGKVWNKNIVGVNSNCVVRTMYKKNVADYLSQKNPGEILCLGSKTGAMTKVLNDLEENYPYKFNKNTVYATIRDGSANIIPDENTAIFTTYDASKGMEKSICIVFDWNDSYWQSRNRHPDSSYEILRNIFCVAASRGKNEIIFVLDNKKSGGNEILSEETLMTPTTRTELTETYVEDMFYFKFVEEIDRAYKMLDVTCINHSNTEIEIAERDGFIDLTPCIDIYHKAVFFDNYDINEEIMRAAEKKKFNVNNNMLALPAEQRILYLVSLLTSQNRYQYQVKTPFVKPEQHNEIIDRLSERLQRDEFVQKRNSFDIHGINIFGTCDVLQSKTIWKTVFHNSLSPEDYLQAAMLAIIFGKSQAMLWNIRNNELYSVSVADAKQDEFLEQVYRIITKQKSRTKAEKTVYDLSSGDRIYHYVFGKGTIRKVSTSKNKNIPYPTYEILFDNGRISQIRADYVNKLA